MRLLTAVVSACVLALPLAPLSSAAQRADSARAGAGELPLEPTRSANFTTREGTWMSLDVSPDGRTIVFDLVGDLYTVPIEGGKATRITEGMTRWRYGDIEGAGLSEYLDQIVDGRPVGAVTGQ